MRKLCTIVLSLLLLLSSSGCRRYTPPTEDVTVLAQKLVSNLAEGKYRDVHATFDRTMRSLVSVRSLQQLWADSQSQFGEFKGQSDVRSREVEQHQVVDVRVQFGNTLLDIRVAYDATKQVAGLFFLPAKIEYIPPDYVDNTIFTEHMVTVGVAPWELPGTLSMPVGPGPFPAVVLVHGSGPQDRDSTLGPNRPFKDIAWGLASQGIAVLRYDKRTLVHGEAFTKQTEFTLADETIDDAVLAVELLQQMDSIDATRIFVLGHSLGGLAAPRIATAAEGLAGLLLLAAPARPLEDLILEQVRYLAEIEGMSAEARAHVAQVEAQVARVRQPDLTPATLPEQLPLGIAASYWLDLRGFDALAVAGELHMPLLVLQGERDYQVTMTDFALWSAALAGRSNAILRSYPYINHLFMAGEGESKPAEYMVPGHVSREVIEDIVYFVTHQEGFAGGQLDTSVALGLSIAHLEEEAAVSPLEGVTVVYTLNYREVLEARHGDMDFGAIQGHSLLIKTTQSLRDFSIISLDVDFRDEQVVFLPMQSFGTIENLLPGEAYVIRSYIGIGTFPRSGITFLDANGQRRYFAIVQNQADFGDAYRLIEFQ